jgi:hypothetical protein
MGVSRHPVSDQKKLDRLDEVIKSRVPFMEKGVTYPKGCDEMPETIKHVLKEAVTRDLSHLSSSPDDLQTTPPPPPTHLELASADRNLKLLPFHQTTPTSSPTSRVPGTDLPCQPDRHFNRLCYHSPSGHRCWYNFDDFLKPSLQAAISFP